MINLQLVAHAHFCLRNVWQRLSEFTFCTVFNLKTKHVNLNECVINKIRTNRTLIFEKLWTDRKKGNGATRLKSYKVMCLYIERYIKYCHCLFCAHWATAVAPLLGSAAPYGSWLMKMRWPFTHSCLSVYKKRRFLPHRPSLVALPGQRRKEKIPMLGPIVKNLALCA